MKSNLCILKKDTGLKKSLFFGAICFLVTFAACSSAQVMKDCKHVDGAFWVCENP